jgi:hypothetical protein
MHHHQSKQAGQLPAYAEVLVGIRHQLEDCESFHELYLALRSNTIWGVGPQCWYDISTRIGAYLSLEPEKLYMHTGVLMGLQALNKAGYEINLRNREWIEVSELPTSLRRVKPDFAEDFLCSYREAILLLEGKYARS